MKKTVYLYWQKSCEHVVCDVAQALRTHFHVTTILGTVKEPTEQSFDTARGQYDAFYLLRELFETVVFGDNNSAEMPFVLWLITEDISYTGHDYLYGVAWKNCAVVSSARIGFGDNLYKEACHETGHLFGLAHCTNACFMNVSHNLRKLTAKPMLLCFGCASKISNHDG